MRRETGNVLLVLLGGALLKIAWNGSYLRYVKPSLLPFLVAAGGVILALGLVAIMHDLRARRDAPEAHEHGSVSPWLLLLPVLAILLVAPPALGADTVTRSAVTLPAPAEDAGFAPLPRERVTALPLSEFVTRAVWDDSGSLDGRQVRLTGFAVRAPNGSVHLARLAIACCAADATPVRVRLAARGAFAADVQGMRQDLWYQVTGALVPGSASPDNDFVPALAVSGLRETPPPTEPYES